MAEKAAEETIDSLLKKANVQLEENFAKVQVSQAEEDGWLTIGTIPADEIKASMISSSKIQYNMSNMFIDSKPSALDAEIPPSLDIYMSGVGVTEIKAINGFKIVQYINNKMYEIIVTDNAPFGFYTNDLIDFPTSIRAMFQSRYKRLRQKKQTITSGQSFAYKEGMQRRVKNPAYATDKHKFTSFVPGCGCSACKSHGQAPEASIYQMVQLLNDTYKWTREQIADWLDTLDDQPVFHPVKSNSIQCSARMVTLEPSVQEKGNEGQQ